MAANKTRLEMLYRGMIYALPVVLYFSYWPWINLGANGTMNFDLSLPLVWLVIFDVVAFVLMAKKKLLKQILDKWVWLLFPGFLTLSLLWSRDVVRGGLIMGVLWLVYFAGFAFVILRKELGGERFRRNFFKVFFGAGLMACVWCVAQCIMDVAGVPQGQTLLCDGCVYRIFGFPHPNGWAAEPQFMGNLLLAPIFTSLYFLVKNKYFSRKNLLIMFFVFVATLFLTLSRGAIYSFGVAMAVFMVVWVVKTKRWRVLLVWPVILVAMLFTLNMQGIFAELSRTDDTYIAGVSKAVNQLTLGVVDLGGSQVKKEKVEENSENTSTEVAPTEDATEDKGESAVFDGYVEVSTSSRVNIWQSALNTWKKDLRMMMFGVGIGGSLKAMYEYGEMDTSREIINNEYVNLLVEVGIVGMLLLAMTVGLVIRAVSKAKDRLLLYTLIIAYMVSLCFFSGLPNALQIYLVPAALWAVLGTEKISKEKQRK